MNRVRTWWDVAVTACRQVTEPRVDVAAADAAVLSLVRASWIGSFCEALVSRVHTAWLDSRCRALLHAAGGRR
jgi:hypothetical protein